MLSFVSIELFVGVIIFIFTMGTTVLIVKGTYNRRKFDDEMIERKFEFTPRKVNKNKPLTQKVAKLVYKSTDNIHTARSINRMRYGVSLPIGLNKTYFKKFYLRFETFEGYKDFTVTEENYHKYRINTYGYIYYQKSRFSHFEVRNKESLGIPKEV